MPRKPPTKTCPRCATAKPLSAFAPDASSADGRYTYCKVCKRAGERERSRRPKGPPVSSGSKAPAGRKPEAPRRPPGRPSKLSAEVIEAITAVLARGHSRRAAAAKAGLPDRTLRRWLAQAAEDGATALERELLEAVELAEGEGEHALAEVVRDAVDVDPNQAKWMLERRYPDWARKDPLPQASDDQPTDLHSLREHLSLKIQALITARGAVPPELAPAAPAPAST